jgi:hypothetical protein
MSITLHQATEQVRALLDQIDPETGELPEGFESARALVATKATAVAAYILESERQAVAATEYVKELSARIKTAERRAEFLREYLEAHMLQAGITEIKDERGIFSAKLQIERDASVNIFDEDKLPADCLREIPAKQQPDKALIKKAIEDGREVPGARIVKKNRLTIR